MKIAHVNYSFGNGGAGKAAKRVFESLKERTEHEIVFISIGEEDSKNINIAESKILNFYYKLVAYFDLKIASLFSNDVEIKSINLFPTTLAEFINKNNFDIVHFHWIGSGLISIGQISQIKAKIFWTFHDQWPILGMNHYEINPLKTKNNIQIKFENFLKARKKAIANKIHVITPSKWLYQEVMESDFNFADVKCIPNIVPNSIYNEKALDVEDNFSELKSKKIVLFATMPSNEVNRKGGDYLIEIYQEVKKIDSSIDFLTIGASIDHEGIFSVPFIKDENELASIYAKVDLVAIPSRLDNLPNIGLESLFCGTRVIGFNVGGLSDIVLNENFGSLIKFDDCTEFAKEIVKLINNQTDKKIVSELARQTWCEKKIINKVCAYYGISCIKK
tara:strand:- start:831 stop:2000 length:1170 start_codon:yes stop_codon:yes gene_type:complete